MGNLRLCRPIVIPKSYFQCNFASHQNLHNDWKCATQEDESVSTRASDFLRAQSIHMHFACNLCHCKDGMCSAALVNGPFFVLSPFHSSAKSKKRLNRPFFRCNMLFHLRSNACNSKRMRAVSSIEYMRTKTVLLAVTIVC